MMSWDNMCFKFLIFALPFWCGVLVTGLQGLETDDIELTFPSIVEQGSDFSMYCKFSPHKFSSIYRVSWVKGTREFFRVTPKEYPEKESIKPGLPGVTVDLNQSDKHKVHLRNVPVGLTGNISCVVTMGEAQNFKEYPKTKYLTVIVQAPTPPLLEISGAAANSEQIRVPDTLRLTCSSGPSKPAANLTFYVNGKLHNESSYRQYPPIKVQNESDNMSGFESRRAEMQLHVTEDLFYGNKIRIKCNATIYDFNKTSNVVIKELYRPQQAASSFDTNAGHSISLPEQDTTQHLISRPPVKKFP